jgi:hypothetical protein
MTGGWPSDFVNLRFDSGTPCEHYHACPSFSKQRSPPFYKDPLLRPMKGEQPAVDIYWRSTALGLL